LFLSVSSFHCRSARSRLYTLFVGASFAVSWWQKLWEVSFGKTQGMLQVMRRTTSAWQLSWFMVLSKQSIDELNAKINVRIFASGILLFGQSFEEKVTVRAEFG